MITKKEKALLDHLYKAGEEIADFIKKNGYSHKDSDMVSLTVSLDRVADGINYDYITASASNFWSNGQPKKIVSKTSNHITNKPGYKENLYEEES